MTTHATNECAFQQDCVGFGAWQLGGKNKVDALDARTTSLQAAAATHSFDHLPAR
jgi:hypothetical protein